MSEEALKIAEKSSKSQRKKGKIYPTECRVPENSKERLESRHACPEFQRRARRDKVFLSEQCKEIEENSRMGKTRDKKIRDTKETFHAKMGSVKDRNDIWT